ncbi:MAG: NYN domain-containing protein [Chloroherpetonaceae bacterium]|nr:NYN domain-containing protein [Chloroherpetonaceae bacterium]MCS7212065.1 NYN domain-containing protein [Chloroherpetonaceae bacterium]MDW8019952.1 NYN domain-containing protein [Chloroherpetonaceae bacterium]MDW8465737.1 NYN domain-containing protein [Chloroherpetonaceae bacterium]
MRRVVVDGYNLAHKLGKKLSRQTLSSVRSELEQALQRYAMRYNAKVTLVYDGRGVIGRSESLGMLEVVFTPSGESADKHIKALIDQAPSKASLTVVSSDCSIRHYAKVSGVASESAETFLEALRHVVLPPEEKTVPEAKPDDLDAKPSQLTDEEVEEWKKLFGASVPKSK